MTKENIKNDQVDQAEKEYPAAQRQVKDTVFKKYFSNQERLKNLASFLVGPLDEETVIEKNTIENVLASNGLFNDLSFRLSKEGEKDHIVLVEAQTRWEPGITLRMQFYRNELLKEYFLEKGTSKYELNKNNIPKFSYFVLYPGTESRPEILSLKEHLFQDPDNPEDFQVKVITTKNAEEFAKEYLQFCQIYDTFNKREDITPIQAIRLAVRQCIKLNIMKDFLIKHEGEVYTMMESLFDQAEIIRCETAAAEERGEKKGEKKGRLDVARNLLKSGKLSLEEIASFANLPLAEIEKLA